MTGSVVQMRRDQAVKIVRFERGCIGRVVGELQGSDASVRVRVAGCGKSWVVLCENAGSQQRDVLEVAVVGAATIEQRCTIVSEAAAR